MVAVKLKEVGTRYLVKFDEEEKSYFRHRELSQEIKSFKVGRK